MCGRIQFAIERVNATVRGLARRLAQRLVVDAVEGRAQDWIGKVLRQTPINETSEEDVFLVGYPKSGNTWLQNLVAGAVYGVDPAYAPDTLIQELIPDLHYMRYYKRYRTPMFFKSHHLPKPNYRRVVYLLRDGRDVMVSYWHYLSALKHERIDFLKMVRDGETLFPSKWHEHVDAWLANSYGAQLITVRYEDLKRDPVRELQRLCDFVGLERDSLMLEHIAEQASFQSLRRKVDEGRYFQENPVWPSDQPFFRRGTVGSYKDEMPPDVLNAFLTDAQETLFRCNYV